MYEHSKNFEGLALGCVLQSVGHLTRKSEVLGSIPGLAFPSSDSRGAVVSYWQKYVHEVLVNRLGGLSLPRKSVVRLTDRPDMTLDVYRGRKTTTQPTNQRRLSILLRTMNHTDCQILMEVFHLVLPA